MLAIRIDPWSVRHIKNPSDELLMKAIDLDADVLQFVPEQTEELCMKAVQSNGMALFSVRKKNPKIYTAAIKQCGRALQYVPMADQTFELAFEAVKQSNAALRFVAGHLKTQVMEALNNNKIGSAGRRLGTKKVLLSPPDTP
jgi:hypothetical protein